MTVLGLELGAPPSRYNTQVKEIQIKIPFDLPVHPPC